MVKKHLRIRQQLTTVQWNWRLLIKLRKCFKMTDRNRELVTLESYNLVEKLVQSVQTQCGYNLDQQCSKITKNNSVKIDENLC